MQIQTYSYWPHGLLGTSKQAQPDLKNTYGKSAGNQIRSHTSYERSMSFPCLTVVQRKVWRVLCFGSQILFGHCVRRVYFTN